MSIVLKAEKRQALGRASARRIKNAGKIPAVIYSKDGNINFVVDVKEFEHEYFKGTSLTTVFEVELDGKKLKVVAHKIELDPVSDRPVHVDFLNCAESKTIKAKPKLNFVNKEKSPGLKKGGFLNVRVRRLEVICDNEKSIPHEILVDVGALHVSSKVRVADLKLPAGVKSSKKGDFLIASITGRGKSEETPAAGAAAAEGAAPAAAKDEKKPAEKK